MHVSATEASSVRIEKAFACIYILDHLVAEMIRFKRLFLRKFALNVLIRAKTHVQHLDANSVSRLTSRLILPSRLASRLISRFV